MRDTDRHTASRRTRKLNSVKGLPRTQYSNSLCKIRFSFLFIRITSFIGADSCGRLDLISLLDVLL